MGDVGHTSRLWMNILTSNELLCARVNHIQDVDDFAGIHEYRVLRSVTMQWDLIALSYSSRPRLVVVWVLTTLVDDLHSSLLEDADPNAD